MTITSEEARALVQRLRNDDDLAARIEAADLIDRECASIDCGNVGWCHAPGRCTRHAPPVAGGSIKVETPASPADLLAHLKRIPMTEWVWADAEMIFATLEACSAKPTQLEGAGGSVGEDFAMIGINASGKTVPTSVADYAAAMAELASDPLFDDAKPTQPASVSGEVVTVPREPTIDTFDAAEAQGLE